MLSHLLFLQQERVYLLLFQALGFGELGDKRLRLVIVWLRHRVNLVEANARLRCLHAATSRQYACAIIDKLDAWISPDGLSLVDGKASSLLCTLDVLKLDGGCLLF